MERPVLKNFKIPNTNTKIVNQQLLTPKVLESQPDGSFASSGVAIKRC